MLLEQPRTRRRRAAAAVELAILLPVLILLFVLCADFARLFYHYLTIGNCARNGALWLSDPTSQALSKYPSLDSAARADATNLDPSQFSVASASGTDGDANPYVEVTVTYQFPLLTSYLGLGTQTLSRTVRMRVVPTIIN